MIIYMTIPKKEINKMSRSEWYLNYHMKYTKMIEHPRFSKEKRNKYWFKLLDWYDNWDNNNYSENK